jgi:hypothetical protein
MRMWRSEHQLSRAIEALLDLRRAERRAESGTREDIAAAREFLEQLIGRTVRPATAARVLGVSHPALKRWIDKSEVASVITPEGRREIPTSELLELLEAIETHKETTTRPIAAVIREREEKARRDIDIDRLLPRQRKRGHRAAELQALAYHRLVAERLDEALLDDARRRLERWEQSGQIDPRWSKAWSRILTKPVPEVAKTISADTPRARELRQTSPFAGVLSEQERRRLVRLVEDRVTA